MLKGLEITTIYKMSPFHCQKPRIFVWSLANAGVAAAAAVAVNYPAVVLITLMSGCESRWVRHKQAAIARTMPSERYGYEMDGHRTTATCHEWRPQNPRLLSSCNCQPANGQCYFWGPPPNSSYYSTSSSYHQGKLIKVHANLNYPLTLSTP